MAAEAQAAIDADRLAAALERAPVLVEALRHGAPYGSVDEVITQAREVLERASEETRITVLDAHPRIGADPASLSELSRREQAGEEAAEVLAELQRLNDIYEHRFGFRFVVFVAGRSKAEILEVLRSRLHRRREDELRTGIEEFLAITRDRLSRS